MPLDLPINEVKQQIEEAINQFGVSVTIDNISTKIMMSDLQRTFNIIDENSKIAVCSKDIIVKKGSDIHFDDGRKAIVLNIPNDDLVSYSMKILICNSTIQIKDKKKIYDDNNGNLVGIDEIIRAEIGGFIERISAKERQFDIGLLQDTVLRFTTYEGSSIKINDTVYIKDKRYRVNDIDDITEGILVVQFASDST